MISKLGYPKSLLGVEKSLADLSHFSFCKSEVPKRRVDVVCFDKALARPLLLIECKAEVLGEACLRQIIGYNYYVKAPLIAVASNSEIRTGYWDIKNNSYEFVEGLMSYQDILQERSS